MKAFISGVFARFSSPVVRGMAPPSCVDYLNSVDFDQSMYPADGSRKDSSTRVDGGQFLSRRSRDRTEYRIGEELTGFVSGIESYGVFIRMPNGESGQVFHNEINYLGEVTHPKIGDKLNVVVIGLKPGRGLALSIRESRSRGTFEDFSRSHPVGSVCTGTINAVLSFGVFVTLSPGLNGLLHVSSIPDINVYGPASINQPIDVLISSIETYSRRFTLVPA